LRKGPIISGTFDKLFPENPAIKIKSSRNVRFENNDYSGDAEVILKTDESLPDLESINGPGKDYGQYDGTGIGPKHLLYSFSLEF